MFGINTAWILIILYNLIGAAIAPLTKIGLRQIPTISFVFIRFLLASLILLPLLLAKKKKFSYILQLLPLSLLATTNIILFIFGIRLTTATIGQLLYCGSPLATAIIGYLIWKQKISYRKILGILIGFIGVGLIILLPMINQQSAFSGNLKGNIMIGLAVISYSCYMLFSKKRQSQYSLAEITSAFIITTTVVLLPFFLRELWSFPAWWRQVSFVSWSTVLYISLLGTIVAYFIHQQVIKAGGALFAAVSFYMGPVMTFIYSAILLNEKLTPVLVVTAVIALVGVYLTTS